MLLDRQPQIIPPTRLSPHFLHLVTLTHRILTRRRSEGRPTRLAADLDVSEEDFLPAEAACAWTAGEKTERWEEVASGGVPRRVVMLSVTCEGVSERDGREELAHVDLTAEEVLDAVLGVFEWDPS